MFDKYSNINAQPRLSIITISYNCAEDLEKTIRSVVAQPISDAEYIVIDGGSTDGSFEVIQKYANKIDYWVSEKDKGIYDAMNKGCEVARGEGLLFLNAGDYLVGTVLKNALPVPAFLPVKVKYKNGKERKQKLKNYKSGIPCSHQGIIFQNKGLFYNDAYKISADYDFFARHADFKSYKIIEPPGYVIYDNSGLSSEKYVQRDLENFNIISQNFGKLHGVKFAIRAIIKSLVKKIFRQ
tara:strand:+ start:1324 stop:2040 length:717 start_codon:yes stop_codon:yes gene_type:complete